LKYKIRLRLIMEHRGANGDTNAVQESRLVIGRSIPKRLSFESIIDI